MIVTLVTSVRIHTIAFALLPVWTKVFLDVSCFHLFLPLHPPPPPPPAHIQLCSSALSLFVSSSSLSSSSFYSRSSLFSFFPLSFAFRFFPVFIFFIRFLISSCPSSCLSSSSFSATWLGVDILQRCTWWNPSVLTFSNGVPDETPQYWQSPTVYLMKPLSTDNPQRCNWWNRSVLTIFSGVTDETPQYWQSPTL